MIFYHLWLFWWIWDGPDDGIRHPQNDRARQGWWWCDDGWWHHGECPGSASVPVTRHPGPWWCHPIGRCVYTWSPQINTCTAAQDSPHTNDASLLRGMGWCQMMDNVLQPSSGWRLYKEASTGCISCTLTRPPGFLLSFLANTKRGSAFCRRTGRVVWCLNVYD